LVRNALKVWALDDLVDVTELIASELVGNAVRHARGHLVRVAVLRVKAGCVRVSVVDRSPEPPAARTGLADEETGGRGLLVLDALAARWGTEPLPWGKRVWAECAREHHPYRNDESKEQRFHVR
jgi:anti-sigma regulatory factor (Ser/Thr protein kinase)